MSLSLLSFWKISFQHCRHFLVNSRNEGSCSWHKMPIIIRTRVGRPKFPGSSHGLSGNQTAHFNNSAIFGQGTFSESQNGRRLNKVHYQQTSQLQVIHDVHEPKKPCLHEKDRKRADR